MARSSDVEYKMRMTQDLKEKIVASAKEHIAEKLAENGCEIKISKKVDNQD